MTKAEVFTAAGMNKEFLENIINGKSFLSIDNNILLNNSIPLGKIINNVPNLLDLPNNLQTQEFDTRTNFLLLPLLLNLSDKVNSLISKYGKDRIGVSIGSTNPGLEENYYGIQHFFKTNDLSLYSKKRNTLYNPAYFVKLFYKLQGPAFTVSTACTSGVKAIIQGYRLIESGICDAVICGGSDALNTLTVNGFHSLQIVSEKQSIPFSKNRDGVNLGEGAALFILTKEPMDSNVRIKHFNSNNEAYHITKQDPNSLSSINLLKAIKDELDQNGEKVDYINLHGTGTVANDLSEGNSVAHVFGKDVLSSSTKPLIGHTLGAAGAIETAICSMLCGNDNIQLPPHVYDDEYDPSIPEINLVKKDTLYKSIVKNTCNINFAFGGDNSAIVVGID